MPTVVCRKNLDDFVTWMGYSRMQQTEQHNYFLILNISSKKEFFMRSLLPVGIPLQIELFF